MATKASFLALLLTATLCTAQQRKQWLLAYPGGGQQGEPVSINAETSSYYDYGDDWHINKDQYGNYRAPGKAIYSACGAGVWVFMAESTVWKDELVSELVRLKDGDCVNLESRHVRGRVKIIQHIGVDQDYEFPSLNLIKWRDYVAVKDDVRALTGTTNNVDHPHISLIITGRTPWAIVGEWGSYCLVPVLDNYIPVQGIPDIRAAPYNLPQDSITSVTKGCTGNEDHKFYVSSKITTPKGSNVNGYVAEEEKKEMQQIMTPDWLPDLYKTDKKIDEPPAPEPEIDLGPIIRTEYYIP